MNLFYYRKGVLRQLQRVAGGWKSRIQESDEQENSKRAFVGAFCHAS